MVVTIEQDQNLGYHVRVDGYFAAYAVTLWGARWAARRIKRRLERGLYTETV